MTHPVRTAVLHRFQACLPPLALRPDREGYVRAPADNLLPFLDEALLDDYSTGAGGELQGALPRFCAALSSSALAANSFGAFRFNPERLSLAGIRGFAETRFEHRLPIGIRGTSPDLDFFGRGPEGVVAIESKFTELLGRTSARFSAAYRGAVDRLAEPAWRDLYESLREDPRRFARLDAAQLLKHYLGIRHSVAGRAGPRVLLYVFWEPVNAHAVPEFATHRSELDEFTALVAESDVRFMGLSYLDLWSQWAEESSWDGSLGHVEALRARYLVTIPAYPSVMRAGPPS